MLLAIDPGLCTGWAIFDSARRLVVCGLGDPRHHHRSDQADLVVVEKPRIYPAGGTKNPNDILKLAIKAGEWGGYFGKFAKIRYVEPREWKGGPVKKPIQNARDEVRLSPDERKILDAASAGMAKSKRHNMLDAVGIGIFAVGRGA